MSSLSGSFDLPRRLSLSAQTTDAIRKGIEEATWQEFLPSERRLCELFEVSRPTVRTALRQLAKEGIISIQHGRRNRILAASRSPASRSRLVVLVSHYPLSRVTPAAYQGISEMRAHLMEHGFTTEILVCSARGFVNQRRKLETFLRLNRVLCFVLLSLGKELQEWFAMHSIPALVLGSCHPAVKLPSLDVDYRSVCRHAAGVLRSKGHRRIAFIVPNSNLAGDLLSEEGFREGATRRTSADDSVALVVRHNGTPTNLNAILDALFASATPPTALLVAKPKYVFIVMVYFLRQGKKVPEFVSLISRDHDQLFENMIAHYRFEGETFAHRLSRLMLQMAEQGHLPPELNLIFPRYIASGTVRQLGP